MYTLKRGDSLIEATEEQVAIIDAAIGSKDNLLVNALAGSAKTTTLEFLAKYMPVQPMLSLAFNKRIATEMADRLPGHVMCKTMNALGHGVWQAAIGRRLMVDVQKSKKILQDLINSELRGDEKREAWDYFSDILKAVSTAKSAGYVPEEGAPPHAKRLVTAEEFFPYLEEPETPRGLVNLILLHSIAQAYKGIIDFDDQIYMPTLFGGSFPRFPVVLGDEAQDFSPLNHEMLVRMSPGRLIAVGDPWQSIYAFRGAATGAMGHLQRTFNMREMTLSVSFRCPQAVVKNSHWRVPHMKWAPWAEPGEVLTKEIWDAAEIPDGAAIICRNNAPLFTCGMALLKAGRAIHIVGSDLGPSLIRALKKLGNENMTQEEVYYAIDTWEADKIRKAKDPGRVTDRADCLRVFASFGPTLRAAINYAEHIFACKGPIQLLSGHKAKGLEWDTVYHLDPQRIPSKWASEGEALEQEYNVRYVIETRARKRLILVKMELFHAE